MTNPTRQEMLSAIDMKIAKVKASDYATSYFLPVMIGDVLDWMDNQLTQKIDGRHPGQRSLLIIWKTKREPLSAQDDDCIAYVYSLL